MRGLIFLVCIIALLSCNSKNKTNSNNAVEDSAVEASAYSETSEVAELKLSDIDVKFSRNRTDSLLVKTQGLNNMLQAGVHPLIAITHCGLFSDPQSVWNDSKAYMGKWLYDAEEDDIDDTPTVSDGGHSGGEDNIESSPRVQAQ